MDAERERGLIEAAKRGDLSAFDTLAATYERQLYAFALRLTGDHTFAEEAVQEVLVRAWSSLRRFDPEKSFRGWLFGIASHVCTDWLRRRGRRRAREAAGEPTSTAVDVPDTTPGADPHQASQRREMQEEVAAALGRLPPSYRTVIVLRFQHEMKLTEVAETLRISPKAAEVRIRRAKAKLRPLLEPLYPELAASFSDDAASEDERRRSR